MRLRTSFGGVTLIEWEWGRMVGWWTIASTGREEEFVEAWIKTSKEDIVKDKVEM